MTISSENLSKEQKDLMYHYCSIMDAIPIYICDTFGSIKEIARYVKEEVEDGVLLVDYLQLIDSNVENGNNRTYSNASVKRVLKIPMTLKWLAKDKEMPIIVCSQLLGAVEYHSDKHPTLRDLREADSIEQHLDSVVFIYCYSYYYIDGGNEDELIIVKNRNGETVRLM